MNIRKNIFTFSNLIFDKRIIDLYQNFFNGQLNSKNEIEKVQLIQLNKMLKYCYDNVDYYQNIFNENNIIPDDINNLADLNKLPILSKEIINSNIDKFTPRNLSELKFHKGKTGGTTGTPLVYRVDHEQRIRGIALLYFGFANAGYEFGDKIAFLGGSSIGGSNNALVRNFYKYGLNFIKLSSFDMDDRNLNEYYQILQNEQPKFIRGYPSSIFYFSEWIEKNKLGIKPLKAIFTTSEKLHDYMRSKIENVFQCKVFDGYGLNDGGLFAFECNHHKGMHIDTNNSIFELVDEQNNAISNGEGRVIATSLYNYAFPFLRYDTGDIATITDEICSCGNQTKRITEIVGRSVDILQTPNGKNIHGWFFLYIFWEHCKGIKQYQVIQEDLINITIKIVKEDSFDEMQIKTITDIVKERSPNWKLNFEFVEKIEATKAGKYKFIINEIKSHG